MKQLAFALILILMVLECSDADARSRRNSQSPNVGGSYFLLYGGVNSRPDATITFSDGSTDTDSFDDGIVLGLAIGQRFNEFRFEGEVGYRTNDDAVFNDPSSFAGAWTYNTLSFMLNGYYDFNMGRVKPYLGLGAGFAQATVNVDSSIGSFSDSDTVIAYQFMGGIGLEITPATTFFVGYRYFTTLEQSFSDLFAYDSEYASAEYLAGFRFNF